MTYDAAIVGAGIVGVACAAALADEGLSVIVIDPNGIATATTAAGMGHIVVMDDSEAQFALTRYSQLLWDELAEEIPDAAEYEHRGTIWVAADNDEMNEVRRKHSFYRERGIESEILDEGSLCTAEPNLRDELAGGLLVKSDSVVYQVTASRFLIDRAQRKRCKTRFGNRAVSITDNGVMLDDGSSLSAGVVINAAGVNAPQLSSGMVIDKRKGHLVISDRYPNFAHHQLVEIGYLKSAHGRESDSVAFNLQPRATGQMLLGSSRQFGTEDVSVDREMVRRMTSRAFEYMPTLRELSALRIWTGFRPSTPDNLPYIGPSPSQKNTYVAAGHEGLGITTALGTAALITRLILGREPAIPIEPYLPSRKITTH